MQSKMRYEQQEITPELAKEYLKHNTNNRPVRTSRVGLLAKEMLSTKAKGLEPHPAPILFDENGTLLDGQHRLHAIIALDMPVKMMVGYGFKNAIFGWLDSGATRNMGDRLNGLVPREFIPAVRMHMKLREEWFFYRERIGGVRKANPTHDEYCDFYVRLKKEYVSLNSIVRRRGRFHSAVVVAALAEMCVINMDKCAEFVCDIHHILDSDAQPTTTHANVIGNIVLGEKWFRREAVLFSKCIAQLRRYLKNEPPIQSYKPIYYDWYSDQLEKVKAAIKGER